MTDTTPNNDQTKAEEIPLGDIDKLLEKEDPEFTKSLEEVRAVESAKDVEIDAAAIDESQVPDEPVEGDKKAGKIKALRLKLKTAIRNLQLKFQARLKTAGKDFVQFLKVRPKQFALFAVKAIKAGIKGAAVPINAYQEATRVQKITVLTVILLGTASVWVLLANFKGIWIPQINEPLLANFETVADHVEPYNPKDDGESFYSAFPQERHEYLFPKFKVNLARTADNPDPMGAFEIIAVLDSKDTAIEVSDRQVEFSDLVQRVFEEETFTDLATELGKQKLKSKIKRELNQKLTQGWAKDINFKTFVLKP